jgi:hypothetical protein
MNDNIEKILLSTSQSMKELKVINQKIKNLDKNISKIVFEEKKRVINKIYIKKNEKYFTNYFTN